jgi:alpha-glucosidase
MVEIKLLAWSFMAVISTELLRSFRILKKLGVNAIYFTPTFPSRSNHRYDATSFEKIDPLLGGDLAFLRYLKAAQKIGIRTLSDLTTNHCGLGHSWIQKALQRSTC